MSHSRRIARAVPLGAGALGAALLLSACASSTPRSEQFRLPGSYNHAFYDTHSAAARSFYAAHIAHFGVYEVAMVRGERAQGAFAELAERVRALVAEPPRFEPPAELIAPSWVKIAYPTSRSMEWTHMLHSQLYDILTDPGVEDRRAAGETAIAYYLSKDDAAFSTRGYGHRWMEGGGDWAGVFRAAHPELNGILWAYHWHHAAVYEALMEPTPEARDRELDRVITTFVDSVLVNPPETMPLTAEIAPEFSRLFPAAAQIFDNLHMMHDVANDIMVDPELTLAERAAEIERMRRNMSYAAQDSVVAPGMVMEMMPPGGGRGGGGNGAGGNGGHTMSPGGSRVPTELPDGSWLPQGHPDARTAPMSELMAPLRPDGEAGAGSRGQR